jgi:hypothetical protein
MTVDMLVSTSLPLVALQPIARPTLSDSQAVGSGPVHAPRPSGQILNLPAQAGDGRSASRLRAPLGLKQPTVSTT